MSKVLVLYASRHGQTTKIAARLAERLRGAGHQAELHELGGKGPVDLAGADAVVLGSPVYMGKHLSEVVGFARRHRDRLAALPSAFFSVSLSTAALGRKAGDRAAAERAVRELEQSVGWRPALSATFAGSLSYREYGLITRWLMRWMSRRAGGDTDTSRDYEYTDWPAVDRFADAFVARLRPGVPPRPEPLAPPGPTPESPR